MTYFNTTALDSESLALAARAAESQEEAVRFIFAVAKAPLSPSDVLAVTERAGRRWPLHSIRRAITVLTGKRELERMNRKKLGLYGRPEYLWQAVRP